MIANNLFPNRIDVTKAYIQIQKFEPISTQHYIKKYISPFNLKDIILDNFEFSCTIQDVNVEYVKYIPNSDRKQKIFEEILKLKKKYYIVLSNAKEFILNSYIETADIDYLQYDALAK